MAIEEIENSFKSISNAGENTRTVQNRFLRMIENWWRLTVESPSQVDSTIQRCRHRSVITASAKSDFI